MKRLKLFSIIFFSLLGNSCIKDKITIQKAYIYNNTSHNITILCYKNGVVLAEDTIRLSTGDSILFGESHDFGDYRGPGFDSKYAGNPEDSRVVIFDNEYSVYHYNIIMDSTVKFYPVESIRNLRNPNSYEFEMIRTKKERTNIHNYYFTEADYEYAKE